MHSQTMTSLVSEPHAAHTCYPTKKGGAKRIFYASFFTQKPHYSGRAEQAEMYSNVFHSVQTAHDGWTSAPKCVTLNQLINNGCFIMLN